MTGIVERFRRVELAALESLQASARPEAAYRLQRVGGVAVSIAGRTESVVLNRAVGLGVEGPATEDDVARVARLYEDAGVGRHIVHLDPDAGPDALPGWLARVGYRPYRGWAQFARPAAGPLPEPPTDLEIRPVTAETADTFGRIVADAFDLGEAGVPLLATLALQPDWRASLTFDESGEAAGAGALFVHERAGWLDWAATRPAFRQRGSQAALLARALRIADEAGCEVLFCETGEAVTGDPQHSYRNVTRAGFDLVRVRENRILER